MELEFTDIEASGAILWIPCVYILMLDNEGKD